MVLPFQAFLYHVHVQQPQKTAAITEAQRDGSLWFKDQRRVIEL